MTRRTDRLNELFRQEISRLMHTELKDPRVGFATVSRVEVTEDLSYARVFVSVMGSRKERTDTLIGLSRSANFIRTKLFRAMKIRKMPQLEFVLDESLDHSLRVQEILTELRASGELNADDRSAEQDSAEDGIGTR